MANLISTNPAKNYEVVGEVPISTPEEISEKVARANAAKKGWKQTPLPERIQLLEQVYEQCMREKAQIAKMIIQEVGKLERDAKSEVEYYLGDFKLYLDTVEEAVESQVIIDDDTHIEKVLYEPWGTVAVICPWNYPFGMAIWGIIPNLLVGNTVVFKTSEECPLTEKLLEEIFRKVTFPQGVIEFVYGAGDVGDRLTNEDINMIWFTGSSRTGRYLYKKAGEKFIPAIMELGGSSPAIVFDTVNIQNTADVIFNDRFDNCGQVCSAIKRVIVHESVYNELVTTLQDRLSNLKIGPPGNPNSQMSSLVSRKQQELALEQIQDAIEKGATLYYGQSVDELDGAYIQPVIITGVHDAMRVWYEETFAPILPIVSFSTEQEAIDLANDTIYGLNGVILTNDTSHGIEIIHHIDAGLIEIGEGHSASYRETPFGGYKKSGMGREHGTIGFRQLCQIKSVSILK